MANEQNLLKGDAIHKFTPEEHSRGGKASGRARTFKATMKKMLAMDVPSDKIKDEFKKLGFTDEEINITLLTIYDKSEIQNISDAYLKWLVNELNKR